MARYLTGTIIICFLFGIILLLPTPATAAYDTVTFDALTTTSLWGIPLDLTIKSGSKVESMTVNATNLSFDMLSGSTITVTDTTRKNLVNSKSENVICTDQYSRVSISTFATETVTITPSSDTCGAPIGGGGGGGSTPPPPTDPEPEEETATTTEDEVTEDEVEVVEDEVEIVEDEVVITKPISEMTVTELKAEIVRIGALIAELQAELLKMIGGEGQITMNLKLGDSNSEVELLQTWLSKDTEVYPEGIVSGWFGPLTKAAVIRFQEKYFDEVLAPWNFTAGTGYVGSTTRAQLNALYGGQ